MGPVRAFATVFLAVFLIIFLGSALVTFLMPKTYTASARLAVSETSQVRVFQSVELLAQVSRRLDLPTVFAVRYGESKPWSESRVETALRRLVQVRQLPGTNVVEVRVSGRFPAECARLANEVAEAGAQLAPPGSASIRIIDQAEPPLRASRPNKALNLALGAVVGIFLGTMSGGVGAKLAVGFDRSSRG